MKSQETDLTKYIKVTVNKKENIDVIHLSQNP